MHTLPPRLKKALSAVSRTLSELGVRRVLVGSTASYLNGVEVKPIIDKLTREGFRISKRILESFLRELGELTCDTDDD